jgi:hypothetical protein
MSDDIRKQFTENRPANALQFRLGRDFSVESKDDKHAVTLIAFSGKELSHWWWGRCIFDRAGAVIPLDKIPIDYQHCPTEVLGYLDKFSGESALECSGYLVPFGETDRASEILYKKSMGVPYQCSVSLGDGNFEFEYIPRGQTVTVNGQTFSTEDEELVIFRKYEVHGVAICLYGSDWHTTLFNQPPKGTTPNPPMSKTETTPAPKETDMRELAQKFAKKFGNELGFKYFSESLTEQEANEQYAAKLFADSESKDEEIAKLKEEIEELKEELEDEEEKKPVKSEDYAKLQSDFAKLQEQFNRVSQAAGMFGGEQTAVSNTSETKPKKEFSPLPPGMQGYAEEFRK